jgi:Na+-driven multidrug efflux pump
VLVNRVGLRLRVSDFFNIVYSRVRRVLRIGLPAAAENVCYWTAFMFVTRQVAGPGEQSLAIQQYTMQLQRVVIIFSIAIGLATEILVGHHVGAGQMELAYKQPIASVRTGVLLATALVALIALASPWLAAAFTQDPQVVAGCVLLMRMSVVIEAGRVFNIVLINSLRATGDVRFPIQMAVVSMWFVWVPMAWCAVHWGFGLVGVWVAMATDEWVRGLMMLRRWRQRTWVPFAERSREQVLSAQ